MADPKTIINNGQCPAEIKKSLYRHDQIVNQLQKLQKELKEEKNLLEKYMWNIANFLKDSHVPITFDYMNKYTLTEADFLANEPEVEPKQHEIRTPVDTPEKQKDPDTLTKELKEFRLATSRAENLKPYFIFDNKQMEDLVAKRPKTIEELLAVHGFGPKKAEKYGAAILKILNG